MGCIYFGPISELPCLRYSLSTDSVYCGPCRSFGPQSGDSQEMAFGTTRITDWSNLGELITRHEVTKSHQNSLLSSTRFFLISLTKKQKMLLVDYQKGMKVLSLKHILKCIIETIILCGNQGLALRGHNKEDRNFSRLLHYMSTEIQFYGNIY